MGLSAINLPEVLRFWVKDGLTSILSSSDVVTRLQQPVQKPASVSSFHRPKRVSTPPQRGEVRSRSFPSRPSASTSASSSPVSVTSKQGDKPTVSDAADLIVFPWDDFIKKLSVPSHSVWTYWDLGHDFGRHPDSGRRELFKKILYYLHWPKGMCTFWPATFEHHEELVAQPSQFWRGVRQAQAHVVFCFGETVFASLFPRRKFTYVPFSYREYTIFPLPSPADMLAGKGNAKQITWKTLKSYTVPR